MWSIFFHETCTIVFSTHRAFNPYLKLGFHEKSPVVSLLIAGHILYSPDHLERAYLMIHEWSELNITPWFYIMAAHLSLLITPACIWFITLPIPSLIFDIMIIILILLFRLQLHHFRRVCIIIIPFLMQCSGQSK